MYRGAMFVMGLCAAVPASAQSREDDVARLTRLIEQQQTQIARLEARLAAVEEESRPSVLNPVTTGGSGAIELAARYEAIDYSSNPTAGRGTAATLGVNWCLNNFVRLQMNLVDWNVFNPATVAIGNDRGQTMVGRAQIAF